MSWSMQFEGSKEGVKRALDSEKLAEGSPDLESYSHAKSVILDLIDRGSPTQTGVRVLAAGHLGEVIRLEVEGRALDL